MADPRIFIKQDGIIKMELQDDDDDDDDDDDETSVEESKNSCTGDHDMNSMSRHHDPTVGINRKGEINTSNSEERDKVTDSKVTTTGVKVGSVLSLSLTAKKKDPRAVKSASIGRQLPLSKKRRLDFPTQKLSSPSSFTCGDANITSEGDSIIVQATVLSTDEENDSQDDNEVVEAIPMSDDNENDNGSHNGEEEEQTLKVTPSSKSRKFRPNMAIPLVATPSIASDKRVLLHTGPAESLPSGWTEKLYKRTTGLQHTDRYWYSPLLKKKFRSLAQVSRFLDLLKKEHGDEEKAWELFKMNPPGPEETRSKQRSPGNEVGNKKESVIIKNENCVFPKKSRGGAACKRKDSTVPPIASPGLYIVPPPSVTQLYHQSRQKQAIHTDKGENQNDGEVPVIELNEKGYITPSLLFDHALSEAGFSKKKMLQAKHFGSSILWTVDDIFSRDFCLIDTDVVPKDICNLEANLDLSCNNFPLETKDDELQQNMKALRGTKSLSSNRALQFDDMIPNSLKTSLPKSYIDAKKEYVEKIKEREQILVEYHKQVDANEDAMDAYEVLLHEWQVRQKIYEKNNQRSQRIKDSVALSERIQIKREDVSDKSTLSSTAEDLSTRAVPDDCKANHDRAEDKNGGNINDGIEHDNAPYCSQPVPPTPSPLVELPPIPIPPSLLDHLKKEQQLSNLDINPLQSMPETKRSLLAHLDPESFIIGGRYYGLLTNNIADPQFVGPNAPGISGLSHINNRVHTQKTTNAPSALVSSPKPINVKEDVSTAIKSQVSLTASTNEHVSVKKSQSKVKSNSFAHLKQIIGRGGEEAESMRMSIIKAGVFASRNSIELDTFIGANGETFQGLSKAFSNYSNCKPCARCKSNKQGAYHCRLKRKHDDLDHDGGSSYSILAPLFQSPLEDLYQGHNHLGTT